MSVTIPSARDTEWIPKHLPAEEAVNAIEGGSNCLCLDKIVRGFIRWLLIKVLKRNQARFQALKQSLLLGEQDA